jgi:hypothetical protein
MILSVLFVKESTLDVDFSINESTDSRVFFTSFNLSFAFWVISLQETESNKMSNEKKLFFEILNICN